VSIYVLWKRACRLWIICSILSRVFCSLYVLLFFGTFKHLCQLEMRSWATNYIFCFVQCVAHYMFYLLFELLRIYVIWRRACGMWLICSISFSVIVNCIFGLFFELLSMHVIRRRACKLWIKSSVFSSVFCLLYVFFSSCFEHSCHLEARLQAVYYMFCFVQCVLFMLCFV